MNFNGFDQYGRYYEELEVNATFQHYPGRTISEADDTWFSLLTMNQHPLHINSDYAEKTESGRNLVNGTLVFSIAVGLSVRDISGKCIANLGYDDIRHLGPTYHGDTIYATSTVLDKRESASKDDRGVVYIETIAHNQHGDPILSFKRTILVPKQHSPYFRR